MSERGVCGGVTGRASTALALILSTFAVAVSAAGLVLVQRVHGTLDEADATGSAVLAVSFALIGGVIVARRGHVIGWIMLLSGFFGSLNTVAAEYSYVALEEGWPLRSAAAWVAPWVWSLGAAAYPLVLLLFPTGRPPSPRWWPVAAMTICGALMVAVAGAIEAWPLAQLPLTGEQVFDRTGEGVWGTLEAVGVPLLGSSLLLAAVSLGFRYRGAGQVERQEIKWLLLGGALTIVVMFTASPAAPVDVSEAIPLLSYGALFALPAIPVAVGIAITRYHLYDIDVVINRTLVYALLTAALALVYLAVVVVMQRVLGEFTEGSDLAVAASTLAVAALFRPLRGRIQAFIDQRFYRRKYDARRTLDSFSSRLRDTVDLDSLSNELVEVVGETMQPAHVSVWLRSLEPAKVGTT
ncbi:MAG: hypothetical protein M3N53_12090 [Actinomycetota bacterium]|nr:hypothetical protein [Actinomycetota bacterium]